MTPTSPDSVPRAAPRWRARAAAALGVALLMLSPLPAAAATDPTPGPTPTATANAAPTFAMGPGDRGIVRSDLPVIVDVTASNPASTPLDAAEVRIERGNAPLGSRAALGSWLSDQSGVDGFTAVGGTVLDALPARGSTATSVSLDLAALAGLPAGVYPLRATYLTERGELTSASTLIVPAVDRPAGQVTVVVPITAGALSTALLTADELATLTASDGALRAQLDAVAGTAAVLAVDPAIPTAIRALGTTAPATATAWLADLLALPNERFALQFGDADLATQLGAGLSTPLQVGDIDALAPRLTPAGTPTPTPTPDPQTTTEQPASGLDGIGTAAPAVLWPASGSVGAAQIATLGAVTDGAAASLTLVSSASVTGPAAAHSRAGDADLLVYDADISDALRAASAAITDVDRDAATAEATAYQEFTDPAVPLAVTVDRSAARTPEGLSAAVTTAQALLGRSPVGMSALRAVFPDAVTLGDAQPDAAWVDAFASFRADADALAQFATILADPAVLTVPDRARTLQIIGNAWRGVSAWPDAVAAQRARTTTTLESVELVPVSDINLLGTSAPLSFTVRNDLAWPVSLVLYTVPGDPRIIVQTTTTVEAGAAQATRVNVPVEARVGSGEAELSLQLRSPTMVAIGDPMEVTVNVRAEWEQIGVVVLSVLVGGFLLIGVIRTVRRRRRARDLDDGDTTSDDDRLDDGRDDGHDGHDGRDGREEKVDG
ncbi:DUF6049 family protein [Microbacterium sp. W1N]|uniref:DUF6049 family protein n=1 Tax=Microbacterium festucae TaxID=2977531 RepID=UPI0021C015AC|nr:DUF6049 family protein [Microbacterium festucae]MCT9819479.1 DUF6049 family protein [Microbacterium festucae]